MALPLPILSVFTAGKVTTVTEQGGDICVIAHLPPEDYARLMAAGLTTEELSAWIALAGARQLIDRLPHLPGEMPSVGATAIHTLETLLVSRVVTRGLNG